MVSIAYFPYFNKSHTDVLVCTSLQKRFVWILKEVRGEERENIKFRFLNKRHKLQFRKADQKSVLCFQGRERFRIRDKPETMKGKKTISDLK